MRKIEDVKRGLRCLGRIGKTRACSGCPYEDTADCMVSIASEALACIAALENKLAAEKAEREKVAFEAAQASQVVTTVESLPDRPGGTWCYLYTIDDLQGRRVLVNCTAKEAAKRLNYTTKGFETMVRNTLRGGEGKYRVSRRWTKVWK